MGLQKDDGGPAFPRPKTPGDLEQKGMSLRDYFAIHAPAPSDAAVNDAAEHDKMANPHGDTYKPRRRSRLEIICDLRYAFADAMLEARKDKS